MAQLFTNNASGTLASQLNAGVGSLVLNSGEGALFPSPTGSDFFLATLANSDETAWEIVKCTSRSSDTLTITRAQEGTSDTTWPAGTVVELRLTAGTIRTPVNLPVDQLLFGFIPGANETTLSFNDSTYQFTVTPTGTTWSYYRLGLRHTITGAKSVTFSGSPPATGSWFVYIDSTDGTLTASQTPWTLDANDTKVFVAEVEWNPSLTPKYLLYDERHLADITRGEHAYLHRTQGSRYRTGGVISGYTLDDDTNDDSVRFDISQAQIYDETLLLTISAFTAGTDSYICRYRDGSGGWNWVLSGTPYLLGSGTGIGYDDGDGTFSDVSANYFVNCWLLITAAGFQVIQPQTQHANIGSAISEDFTDLTLTGIPVAEFVARWRLTYEHKTSFTTAGEVQLTAVTQINAGAVPASTGDAPALHASTHLFGGPDAVIVDTSADASTYGISANWAYGHEQAADPHTGYVLESAVGDTDIFSLSLPANTTITTFAATFLDDTSAAAVKTTLGIVSPYAMTRLFGG